MNMDRFSEHRDRHLDPDYDDRERKHDLEADKADHDNDAAASESKQKPRTFYWKQCYELDGRVHWALCDTETDADSPPLRITDSTLIMEAHEPKHFDIPFDKREWPKLIVKLLNEHFRCRRADFVPPTE